MTQWGLGMGRNLPESWDGLGCFTSCGVGLEFGGIWGGIWALGRHRGLAGGSQWQNPKNHSWKGVRVKPLSPRRVREGGEVIGGVVFSAEHGGNLPDGAWDNLVWWNGRGGRELEGVFRSLPRQTILELQDSMKTTSHREKGRLERGNYGRRDNSGDCFRFNQEIPPAEPLGWAEFSSRRDNQQIRADTPAGQRETGRRPRKGTEAGGSVGKG